MRRTLVAITLTMACPGLVAAAQPPGFGIETALSQRLEATYFAEDALGARVLLRHAQVAGCLATFDYVAEAPPDSERESHDDVAAASPSPPGTLADLPGTATSATTASAPLSQAPEDAAPARAGLRLEVDLTRVERPTSDDEADSLVLTASQPEALFLSGGPHALTHAPRSRWTVFRGAPQDVRSVAQMLSVLVSSCSLPARETLTDWQSIVARLDVLLPRMRLDCLDVAAPTAATVQAQFPFLMISATAGERETSCRVDLTPRARVTTPDRLPLARVEFAVGNDGSRRDRHPYAVVGVSRSLADPQLGRKSAADSLTVQSTNAAAAREFAQLLVLLSDVARLGGIEATP